MQMIARALGQPTRDEGGLVGGVVAENQVYMQIRTRGRMDLVEEAPELHRAMPSVARSNEISGLYVEGGEEGSRAVAAGIVGTALNLTGLHGQQGHRPVKGLDLRLLVDAQRQDPMERMEAEPDDVADLVDEQRVGREFERLGPVWLEGKGAPDACYGALAHTHLRRHRVGAPASGVYRDGLQRQRHHSLHLGIADLLGTPGRCSSSSPSSRRAVNRARHLPIACLTTLNAAATGRLLLPSAHVKAIRERSTRGEHSVRRGVPLGRDNEGRRSGDALLTCLVQSGTWATRPAAGRQRTPAASKNRWALQSSCIVMRSPHS